MPEGKRAFLKNLYYAFAAQALSLTLSALIALLLPKYLGIEEYGYWQLFLFYSSYVGFFHFGLNDGVYLKFGGIAYDALDKPLIGAQFRFGMLVQSVIALAVAAAAFYFAPDEARRFVWIVAAVYLLLYNASLYLGYVFQATNLTRLHSISVILDKCFFMAAIAALLVGGAQNFRAYVALYLVAKGISLAYCMVKGREVAFAPGLPLRRAAREALDSVKVGANLMLANIASMLILGIGRFLIDRVWGIEAFARFSLAMQLTSFFLQFIAQVSIVLFPALRRFDETLLSDFYALMRDALSLFLPAAFLAYAPVKAVLALWLPQYQDSLSSMALLLPICLFDGKMQMLCNTYFKVLRKERVLLKVNMLSMALSFALSLFGVLVIHNLYFVIVSIVVTVAFRSVASEIYLGRLLGQKAVGDILMEISLAAAFMLLSWFLPPLESSAIFALLYAAFLFVNRKRAVRAIKALRKVPKST